MFQEGHWLERYLVQRGGRSRSTDLVTRKIEWPDSPVESAEPVREDLQIQKELLENLERLAALAGKIGNNALEQEIGSRYLHRKSKQVKDMGDFLQQTVKVTKQSGHGMFHVDEELRRHNGEIPWGRLNGEKAIAGVSAALLRKDS